MRFPRWRRRDRIRTCRECGEVWRVSAGLARAKRPSRWFSGYSPGEIQWSGSGMFDAALRDQTREVARRRRDIDDQMETIDRARQCPRCGARSSTERKA